MEITASARKRGISDEDIHHAVEYFIRVFVAQGDYELTMFIGPTTTGALIEVGVIEDEDGARAVHAMPARSKYLN